MAGINVWPIDAVSGAPVFSARRGRQLSVAPFVAGATATRPLGARSGVRPGTSTTATVTVTSTTWTVNEHAGVVDVETANEAGPYTYSIDAVQTGSMTAADPSNPRIDLLSIQVSDNAEDGLGAASAALVYTVGAAAATPSAPATPARSMALVQINVPKSGGGSPSVVWVAPFLSAPGGIAPGSTAAAFGSGAYVGQYIDDPSLGLLRWNGTAWLAVVPTLPSVRFKGYLNGGENVTVSTNMAFHVSEDTNSAWNSSSNYWVCPVAGTYLFIGSIKNNATGAASSIRFMKNGTTAFASPNFVSQAYGGGSATYYARLAVGNTIAMQSGASYTCQSDAPADNNFLEIVQVQV